MNGPDAPIKRSVISMLGASRRGVSGAWELLRKAGLEWMDDAAPRLGAAISFYSLLSLAPLLIFSVAVAGWAFGQEAARGELVERLRSVVGVQAGQAIESVINNARYPQGGLIASTLGAITLLFGASGVWFELKHAMNVIWDVPPRPNAGLLEFLRAQAVSFAMVLAVGVLLIGSIVLSTLVAAFRERLPEGAARVLAGEPMHTLVSLAAYTLIFAALFKVLPDRKTRWRDLWIGAALTAVLFAIGRIGIAYYLAHASVGSAYGAAGSLVVLLVWIFYSVQIFFFGAELAEVISNRNASAETAH